MRTIRRGVIHCTWLISVRGMGSGNRLNGRAVGWGIASSGLPRKEEMSPYPKWGIQCRIRLMHVEHIALRLVWIRILYYHNIVCSSRGEQTSFQKSLTLVFPKQKIAMDVPLSSEFSRRSKVVPLIDDWNGHSGKSRRIWRIGFQPLHLQEEGVPKKVAFIAFHFTLRFNENANENKWRTPNRRKEARQDILVAMWQRTQTLEMHMFLGIPQLGVSSQVYSLHGITAF